MILSGESIVDAQRDGVTFQLDVPGQPPLLFNNLGHDVWNHICRFSVHGLQPVNSEPITHTIHVPAMYLREFLEAAIERLDKLAEKTQ